MLTHSLRACFLLKHSQLRIIKVYCISQARSNLVNLPHLSLTKSMVCLMQLLVQVGFWMLLSSGNPLDAVIASFSHLQTMCSCKHYVHEQRSCSTSYLPRASLSASAHIPSCSIIACEISNQVKNPKPVPNVYRPLKLYCAFFP